MAQKWVRVNKRKQSVKNVEVLGLRELEKFLKEELPDAIQRRNVTISALKDSAESMLQGAKVNADTVPMQPHSGGLSESIGIKAQTRGKTLGQAGDTYAAIFIAPMGKASAYNTYVQYWNRGTASDWLGDRRLRHGHLVEFGFRHKSGKQVPARPWLRPAFDTYSSDFLRGFKYILKDKVRRAARKNKRKRGVL